MNQDTKVPFRCLVEAFIDGEIARHRVTIFSQTTCPFSWKAKQLLDTYSYGYNAVELDEMSEDGHMVQERLLKRTGQSTLPNIFINTEHLGGYEDLEYLHECGILDEVIEGKLSAHPNFDHEIVVIGGGSAGLSTALSCAKEGKNVCVIDFVEPTRHGVSWGLGGTCTNVGCIPKKLIHRAAVLGIDIRDAPSYGWTIPTEEVEHDWPKLVNTVQDYIEKLNWTIRKDMIANNITYINGMAHLNNNHKITVKLADETEKTITTLNIVIAVGGKPKYLELPGAEHCITSDEIFSLQEFPGKTLIVGGSYVALELASFLNALKAEVTVMVRTKILNSIFFDRDMADALQNEMAREGVDFIQNCTLIKITKNNSECLVESLVDELAPFTEEFNTVILAVGRTPSTDTLQLENANIKLCGNGKIPVNEKDQTCIKNIFAVGDCANGRPELSSTAIFAGRLLAKRLLKTTCHCTVNYRCIPTSIFTWPEYACCGNSEWTAVRLYGEPHVKIYTSTVTPLELVVTEPAAKCTAKLVTVIEPNGVERLAGFHMIGPNSSEIIQGFAFALRMGASKKDLDCFIGIHPTCAEIFTNLTLRGDEPPLRC